MTDRIIEHINFFLFRIKENVLILEVLMIKSLSINFIKIEYINILNINIKIKNGYIRTSRKG